jgi:hypothetical protein
MKKWSILALGLAAGCALFGQGFVSFANIGPGFRAPFKDALGGNLTGSWMVELWVGRSPDVVMAVPGTMKTVNFNNFGFFNAGTVPIPAYMLDESGNGHASVRVWAPAAGDSWAEAVSTPGAKVGMTWYPMTFTIKANMLEPGFPPLPGAPMENMTPVHIFPAIPEPSVFALGFVGASVLLICRSSRGFEYSGSRPGSTLCREQRTSC